jgi:hypothetical protein
VIGQSRAETIHLHENLLLGRLGLPHHRLCGATIGGKIHGHPGGGKGIGRSALTHHKAQQDSHNWLRVLPIGLTA